MVLCGIINKEMVWPVMKYYLRTFLKGLWKTMKHMNKRVSLWA